MKRTFIIILILLGAMLNAQTKYPAINKQIALGNYTKATTLIKKILEVKNLNEADIYNLNFQIDRMNRINLDFDKTEKEVISQLKKYFPNLNKKMLSAWITSKSLEMKIINGKRMYFHNAVSNLFRINFAAKIQKEKIDGIAADKLKEFLKNYLPTSVNESLRSGKSLINPVRMRIVYTLTVDSNAVPAGETIRCWLPYPRQDFKRQTDVKLLSVNSNEYIIANDTCSQRTLYMEKKAIQGKPTVFQMKLEYVSYSEFHNIDPKEIKPYDTTSELFKEYTSERKPHIVFSEKIKKLSNEIIGKETNPYKKIKKIYTWINKHIPWASAREYSTIDNISEYCLDNMHGDCGIMTLTFMTLARYNGIPCRWQSGWMMHPDLVNLHDWCEVYLNGYGWVPLDQNFGIQDSQNSLIKYFYIGGIDAYRLIVNKDFGQPLFPEKIYPRSETNDFQRGEVEWRGGNIYFDKWNYNMDVEYLK